MTDKNYTLEPGLEVKAGEEVIITSAGRYFLAAVGNRGAVYEKREDGQPGVLICEIPPAPTDEERKEMLDELSGWYGCYTHDRDGYSTNLVDDPNGDRARLYQKIRALILAAPKKVSHAQLPADLAMIQMADSVKDKCAVLARLYETRGIEVEGERP
jgi:hypothetical protein